MGKRRRAALSLPLLPRSAAHLVRQFRRRFAAPPEETPGGPRLPQDALLLAGRTLREAREAHGLGLRDLAQATRISTAVLEALERGWRDRLPEPAYLRTMLALLEQHLALPAGSLEGALPSSRVRPASTPRGSLFGNLVPGSIEVFNGWPGTLLYLVLTLALLHLLNLQQRQLAAGGRLSSRPIPPLDSAERPSPDADAMAALLAAHPDLRPLHQPPAPRDSLDRLRREGQGPRPDLSLGVLSLRLDRPTRLELRSPRGGDTILEEVKGSLALLVLPPFRLRLRPAPPADGVRWRGAPLAAERAAGGPDAAYRFPPASPASPASPGAAGAARVSAAAERPAPGPRP